MEKRKQIEPQQERQQRERLEFVFTAALVRYVQSPATFEPSHREMALWDEFPAAGLVLEHLGERWGITKAEWLELDFWFERLRPAAEGILAGDIVTLNENDEWKKAGEETWANSVLRIAVKDTEQGAELWISPMPPPETDGSKAGQ